MGLFDMVHVEVEFVNGNDMHLVGINLFTFFLCILKIYWKLYIFLEDLSDQIQRNF